MNKPLILCDCSGTNPINADRLAATTNRPCSKLHTALCTHEVEVAAAAIAQGEATICCTQEGRFFSELAAELGAPEPEFLDLRDRAGWTADTGDLIPKMSALVAETALTVPAAKTLDVHSHGLCLIIGPAKTALPVAEKLQDALGVTVLLTDQDDQPVHRGYDVIRGNLRCAAGALGQFQVHIDALQQLDITGRNWAWTAPRDGGQSDCDIILDLTGGTPMFPAPEKREGYLRPDPKDPIAVSDAVFAASQLVGTFEKPLYIRTEALLCAHSRASQSGCTRCLDVCPTGAITSQGDHVSIDPMICAGCGSCASLCPSGALTYDAPPTDSLFVRVQTLARTFVAAGGTAPRLLVVNEHGTEMIALAARFGQGLPANAIPLEVEALNSFGHAEILAALAAGFAKVDILLSPSVERDVQQRELDLATAISGPNTASLLDLSDPDALSDELFAATTPAAIKTPIRPIGTRRQITRQAAKALAPNTEHLPLPDAAPYGAVLVDTDACTLCLSCVSLCPSGALGDNEDKPQLRFQEDACLQCGICANTCPEQAITYEPRLNLTDSALSQVVLHEEDPFECVECGKPFGVKSTIDKITEKLAGKHAMFANSQTAKMIQMCDDCRVAAQFHQHSAPMTGAARPKVRTTDDYLSKRRDH
ncbi:4Fe-4S binding protein [Epibacterium ulvae]|uniref:4Fe-4S binding protein n=1 Tax=Epibacterium ulvae TaxID=1156985 RepID=UPI001BFC7B7F|nr:4Fe-4S binding protein [Epibacterium ulvae]MBT8153177.1 4Fe-4S binding protein [Epibacterium ulvae]